MNKITGQGRATVPDIQMYYELNTDYILQTEFTFTFEDAPLQETWSAGTKVKIYGFQRLIDKSILLELLGENGRYLYLLDKVFKQIFLSDNPIRQIAEEVDA